MTGRERLISVFYRLLPSSEFAPGRSLPQRGPVMTSSVPIPGCEVTRKPDPDRAARRPTLERVNQVDRPRLLPDQARHQLLQVREGGIENWQWVRARLACLTFP